MVKLVRNLRINEINYVHQDIFYHMFFFLGKVLIYFSAGFTRGVDYDVSCTPEGIHVTSSSSSFVLTDKSLPKNKAECKEISHWNSYGGSIFVPSCLNIQENDKFWSDIFPSRAVTEKITKIFEIFLSVKTFRLRLRVAQVLIVFKGLLTNFSRIRYLIEIFG